MIGEKIRQTRISQNRSLADVARRVNISVATLSRIENDKQTLDLGVFIAIARVLNVPPNELLDGADGATDDAAAALDPLVKRITSFEARERTQLWRELAAARRTQRGTPRGTEVRNLTHQVEELLAQIDFMREELENVRKRLRRGAST